MNHPRTRRFIEPPQPAAETALPSGDVTEGVVRIGETVRRPHQPTSFDP